MIPVLFSVLLAASAGAEDAPADPAEKLRAELGSGFIVEKVGPYVVAGNMDMNTFRSLKGTVESACETFYSQFFDKRPEGPIPVYLFKDAESYRAHCAKAYGEEPGTPFGFYRSGALVMNAATGSGTLVHELLHTMMNSDFPDVPSWFNEGLASLFEQCTIRQKAKGLVNWRLPGLRKAIEDKSFVPLKTLVSTTTAEFYGSGSGLHYAEARYLCMYLQEKDLLEKFYKSFRKNVSGDPSGIKTLEEVTGSAIGDLEKKFKVWVSTLKWE